jgi:hypothetical protein
MDTAARAAGQSGCNSIVVPTRRERGPGILRGLWRRCGTFPEGQGLNGATDSTLDLVKAGTVDPVKVTRSALQNAASIAGMALSTEALVVEKQDKKAPAGGGGNEDSDY